MKFRILVRGDCECARHEQVLVFLYDRAQVPVIELDLMHDHVVPSPIAFFVVILVVIIGSSAPRAPERQFDENPLNAWARKSGVDMQRVARVVMHFSAAAMVDEPVGTPLGLSRFATLPPEPSASGRHAAPPPGVAETFCDDFRDSCDGQREVEDGCGDVEHGEYTCFGTGRF
jgi:hypothetical protein